MNSIVQQPADLVTNLGRIFQLYCEGSAGATYQWQYQIYGHAWENVPASNQTATTTTLTWVPSQYDIRFRCVCTFPDQEVIASNSAEISPGTPPNIGMYNGWYYSERYGGLNETQRWHNCNKMMNIFVNQWHWTPEAASGICGNIWAESGFSPGSWEVWPQGGEENTGRGYGFVQWTAARSTIIPYAEQYFPLQQWRNNGDIQIARLDYEKRHNTEWVGHGGWNTVYSDAAPADIADDFVLGYLRPTQVEYLSSIGNRKRYAIMIFENWKNFLLIPILKKITLEGRRNR